jgi:hypothetical protein
MARLFESYVMVDWSAASKPATGADSIWIGALTPDSRLKLSFKASNPPTRAKAIEELTAICSPAASSAATACSWASTSRSASRPARPAR